MGMVDLLDTDGALRAVPSSSVSERIAEGWSYPLEAREAPSEPQSLPCSAEPVVHLSHRVPPCADD